MKTVLFSTAAMLLATAAVAQTPAAPAPSARPMKHERMAMQPMTRAALVAMVQQHFAKLDSNEDGFVTRDEADAAAAQRRATMADRMKQGEASMFDRLDLNHDGSISRDEFDKAHQEMAGRMAERKPMAGRMAERKPMAGRMAERKPMARRMMRRAGFGGHMFEMADANKDGNVSLQEATAAAAARFDKADANHDGTLSPEEMRAAHQAMRGNSSR